MNSQDRALLTGLLTQVDTYKRRHQAGDPVPMIESEWNDMARCALYSRDALSRLLAQEGIPDGLTPQVNQAMVERLESELPYVSRVTLWKLLEEILQLAAAPPASPGEGTKATHAPWCEAISLIPKMNDEGTVMYEGKCNCGGKWNE